VILSYQPYSRHKIGSNIQNVTNRPFNENNVNEVVEQGIKIKEATA